MTTIHKSRDVRQDPRLQVTASEYTKLAKWQVKSPVVLKLRAVIRSI